jgi:hypothetical protein
VQGIFFIFICGLSGCASTPKNEAASTPDRGARASYYDFEDILIPSELSLNKKKSHIYSTVKYKVGLLTFKGRVEPESLADFFRNNLPRNGWKPLASLKDREHLLLFIREDRVCLITIIEHTFSTECEVRTGLIQGTPEPIKGIPSR